MSRKLLVALVALIAGSTLAVAATAAPFRGYDRAAGDQYTTTTTVTVTATATVGGQGTTATPPPAAPTTSTPATETPSTVTPAGSDPDGSDTAPDETSGAGAAPDEDAGAGTPVDSGTGIGSGSAAAGRGAGSGRGSVAVLTIGAPDPELGGILGRILGLPAWAADAGTLNVNALGDAATGTPFAGLGAGDLDDDKLAGLGRLLGRSTGTASGISASLPDLFATFDGAVTPLTGLVLVRSELDDDNRQAVADDFVRAFARGVVRTPVPVVGVELRDTDPSNISFFKKIKGASSVDDLDTAKGQESLKRLLAGAKPGHYGTDEDADARQAPAIDPAAASNVLVERGGSLSDSPLLLGLLLTLSLLAGRALFGVARGRAVAR